MSNNTEPLKITELRKRFDAEKPKYICLRNDQDETEVPWNSISINPSQRMKEIEAFFKRESTPDGLYYFIQKDSNVSSAKERRTPVAKGNIKNLPALRERPQERNTAIQAKAEEVWDMRTAVDKMSQIAELKFENRFLSEENTYLKKRITELEAELDAVEPEETGKASGAKGAIESLKGLAEIFTPAIEKHLELKEKEINQRERYIGSSRSSARTLNARGNNGSGRNDGGIPVTDAGYEDYFVAVMENGSDDEFDYECDYLEKTNPNLYQQFNEKYDLDAEEEEEEEQNNNS